MDFNYDNYIELLQKINKLKNLKRKGWILKKVPNPESVAEHSFQTSIMVLLLADKFNLDKNKCIQMSLIHDVCECIAGDITPHDNITSEQKSKLEKEAMESLFKNIDENIIQLWEEYDKKETPEAIFVSEIDKIETIFQAFEYEQKHKKEIFDLTEFYTYAEQRVKNKELIRFIDILRSKR
jgi:putative hydrolases of HD superfamily